MNKRITDTPIGQEFGWDHLSDVEGDVLVSSHQAAIRVLENPDQFPGADRVAVLKRAEAIEDFLFDHAEDLAQLAKENAA